MARLEPARSGPWIGYVGLACLLWIEVASILFAPWWGVGLMLVTWVAVLLLALGWTRPHPARVTWVPLLGLAFWLGIVAAGAAWWGWGD